MDPLLKSYARALVEQYFSRWLNDMHRRSPFFTIETMGNDKPLTLCGEHPSVPDALTIGVLFHHPENRIGLSSGYRTVFIMYLRDNSWTVTNNDPSDEGMNERSKVCNELTNILNKSAAVLVHLHKFSKSLGDDKAKIEFRRKTTKIELEIETEAMAEKNVSLYISMNVEHGVFHWNLDGPDLEESKRFRAVLEVDKDNLPDLDKLWESTLKHLQTI